MEVVQDDVCVTMNTLFTVLLSALTLTGMYLDISFVQLLFVEIYTA